MVSCVTEESVRRRGWEIETKENNPRLVKRITLSI